MLTFGLTTINQMLKWNTCLMVLVKLLSVINCILLRQRLFWFNVCRHNTALDDRSPSTPTTGTSISQVCCWHRSSRSIGHTLAVQLAIIVRTQSNYSSIDLTHFRKRIFDTGFLFKPLMNNWGKLSCEFQVFYHLWSRINSNLLMSITATHEINCIPTINEIIAHSLIETSE